MGLLAVFLIVLSLRLFFAFHTPYLTTDHAYQHYRSVESIAQGDFTLYDELGYSGRTFQRSFVFDGILAIFSLFFPLALVLKVVPNIFASLLVIPVYLLASAISKNKLVALATALLSSIIPVFIANTFNHASPLTLTLPTFFFLLYAWLKIPDKTWTLSFLIALVFFVFLTPLSLLLALTLGVYLLLVNLEKSKPQPAEYELALFTLFFALWTQFLYYKNIILYHGPQVIWQNLPKELLSSFYASFSLPSILWIIGIIPLEAGTYALYKSEKTKEIILLLSAALVTMAMLWLKLIALSTGLIFLGVLMAILFSYAANKHTTYISQTKFSKFAQPFFIAYITIALISTSIPAYTLIQDQLSKTITSEEVAALESLQSDKTFTILAPPHYGNYITALSGQRNVIDDYYFLQPHIDERYKDVNRMYKTTFETEAVELFDKYNATHLLVPPGTNDIRYAGGKCFTSIHNTGAHIYIKNTACKLRVVA